jgi:two-component system, chemotaxis family, CheB/CheR fusion protein
MPVAVQSHQPRRSPGAAPARLAIGGGKHTQSSRHTQGELLVADRRGEFLAMVLHELKNPLGSILAGVEFARDAEGLLPQSEWLLTGLENAARQVQGLLADLMDLCQASHPTFQLHRRLMDLASAASAAANRRRSDFERLGLSLAIEVGAEAVWVTADPERLELVLGSLLDNAAKYSEPGGRVTVSVEAKSAEVVLRVRDTGVGIAPEVLPFVFDPFVREGIPGVRPRRGSGVGLLLVRTLVELHGGRAEASSAGRGQGSEFVIRLPVPDWDLM